MPNAGAEPLGVEAEGDPIDCFWPRARSSARPARMFWLTGSREAVAAAKAATEPGASVVWAGEAFHGDWSLAPQGDAGGSNGVDEPDKLVGAAPGREIELARDAWY
jgi:hypothetical protein